jgi:hypothetical protein
MTTIGDDRFSTGEKRVGYILTPELQSSHGRRTFLRDRTSFAKIGGAAMTELFDRDVKESKIQMTVERGGFPKIAIERRREMKGRAATIERERCRHTQEGQSFGTRDGRTRRGDKDRDGMAVPVANQTDDNRFALSSRRLSQLLSDGA